MIKTINDFKNKLKLKFKLIQFNKFLKDNMEFIKRITPMNPAISKDDEWRMNDYSKYDEIRNDIK